MRSFFHARSISPTFPPARRRPIALFALAATAALIAIAVSACGGDDDDSGANQAMLITQGQQIFRFDTFGDEAKWTDTLRMHEVISGQDQGEKFKHLSAADRAVIDEILADTFPEWSATASRG